MQNSMRNSFFGVREISFHSFMMKFDFKNLSMRSYMCIQFFSGESRSECISWFFEFRPVFRSGKTGFWFLPTRAIDSEHNEKGPYQFLAPRKHFEKTTFFSR